ncbi:Uma2 family endonuclease [Lacipirellula sp.]|uniref:Uma2 family endonuclease n=1 Tax=Lacipirellula sp. TaxID=2691419 RepID=UPI003D13C8C6
MSTAAHLLTADDLFRMPSDESRWCELVEGEIVHMSPPGAAHGLVTQTLSFLLGQFVAEQRLGLTFAAETGFVVARNPDSVLGPDGSFVRRERIDSLGVPVTYFPEAPDMVFEVLSPGDTVREVGLKMRRWLQAGVELAWVVDPANRTAMVYQAVDDIQVLTEKDMLTGGSVLPGFKCRVADLFAGL